MDAPVPLTPLRIRLPYAAEQEFIARYGSNVSRGGIFIATRALKPEGTALEFELVLQGGAVLLRGEAVVAKTLVDPGGARSGMTLRFVKLDAPSRALIERVIAFRAARQKAAGTGPGAGSTGTLPDRGANLPVGAVSRPRFERAPRPPGSMEDSPEGDQPAPMPPPTGGASLAAPEETRPPAGTDPQSIAVRRPLLQVEASQSGTPSEAAPLAPPSDAVPVPARRPPLHGEASRQTAQEHGLPRPLTAPVVPEPPAALVEPVVGIVVTGPDACAALAGGPTEDAELRSWPLWAAHRDGRWFLGHSAEALEDSVPLFTPSPSDRASNDPFASAGAAADRALLGAHLFSAIREALESAHRRPLRDAVLAVPHWLSYPDRMLLTECCRLAGLRPLQVVHVTSAACAFFAHGRGLARKRVLVLHSAPDTFEAAVIQVTGDDLEVISTLGTPPGAPPSSEQLADIVSATLSGASASAGSLDEVIRFGDPEALERNAPSLAQLLQRPLPEPLRPDCAVLGAALLGRAHAERARGKRGGSVFETLVSPISLVQRDGSLRRVLEIGTRLPAEKTLTVPLSGSELVTLAVCEGSSQRYEEAHLLGATRVESGPLGGELTVHLAVDRNGRVALSTAIGSARLEPRALEAADNLSAELPLTLPAGPERKSGFLRGLVQKLGRG